MSETDVSGCRYFYDNKYCELERNETGHLLGCCKDFDNCYYKQFHQLKKENEELKETLRTSCRYYAPGGECALTARNCHGTSKCIQQLKQKLEKIKELCNNEYEYYYDEDELGTIHYYKILKIIEE